MYFLTIKRNNFYDRIMPTFFASSPYVLIRIVAMPYRHREHFRDAATVSKGNRVPLLLVYQSGGNHTKKTLYFYGSLL
jgi:hypothetical protein